CSDLIVAGEIGLAQFSDIAAFVAEGARMRDRKSTRLNSSHVSISYAVFCLKKKKTQLAAPPPGLGGRTPPLLSPRPTAPRPHTSPAPAPPPTPPAHSSPHPPVPLLPPPPHP